jgi:Flp pilus assembly protein TadG
MVEFALIIPIALFLIIGFFDLGRAIFYYSSISNMVREGARFATIDTTAVVGPYQNNIEFMNGYSFAIPALNIEPDATCEIVGPCTFSSQDGIIVVTITRGSPTVSITATYTFVPITPGIAALLGNSGTINLVAQSTMRLSSHVR